MRTNNINRDAALIGVSSPKQVTLLVLAALNAGKISRAVDQFDEHFKFTDHALGLEFVEVMAQNQPGLPVEVGSRATGFCRRAPGRWYKGRFFPLRDIRRAAGREVVAPIETTTGGVLLEVWTTIGGLSTEEMFGTAKLRSTGSAAIALLNYPYNTIDGRRTVRAGRDEMGSSVEGLKLRRMRIRNDISFNRSTEERTE